MNMGHSFFERKQKRSGGDLIKQRSKIGNGFVYYYFFYFFLDERKNLP